MSIDRCVLWFCCGTGVARCYLGDIKGGAICCLTSSGCLAGCILDGLHMQDLVDLSNDQKELPLLATTANVQMAKNQ